ncbi:MAG TPA: DoxX family protein [Ktedonobacteraceae bacterium]|nr:DoxX family protein [Ktedonobacteraceae bacterium]
MKLAMLEKKRIPGKLKRTVVAREPKGTIMMRDTGLLILRLVIGGLQAGHGSQKFFGWFSGPGLKGTAGWLESIGLKPGAPWASAAAAAEFGGGTLTTLGFLHPLGPMGTIGSMVMATAKAHWGKPIWATEGGAELPVIDMAAALALMLTGPGRFSLDRVFGIRLPRTLVIAIAVVEAVLLAYGILSSPKTALAPTREDVVDTGVEVGKGTL